MGRKKNLEVLRTELHTLKERLDFWEKNRSGEYAIIDSTADLVDALEWALRKLEAEEIGIGDRVRLYVYPDEPSVQPEQGEVIGHTAGGYLIRPFTGKYSGTTTGLRYAKDQVWLVDE